jgi:hypothetical protein
MGNKESLQLINKIKEHIKDSDVIKNVFKKYKVDINELDFIPICFSNLEVSARTAHGVIFINNSLLDNVSKENWEDAVDHYLVHEIVHWVQQTTGTRPTKGADSGDYLENEEEIEGFQNQSEFLADTRDDDAAETYIDQVLDHHEVHDDKARDSKKEELLTIE